MQGIESLTTALLSTALDAASLRQQVIASNIANAGRPDYAAQRVSFEATLAAFSPGVGTAERNRLHSPFDLRMHVETDRLADGTARPISLDQEVGSLSQNSMHYQALLRGLSRYMSLLTSAVSDGKR